MLFFFFNDTATTEIYTLSLHDALPIYVHGGERCPSRDDGGEDVEGQRRRRGVRAAYEEEADGLPADRRRGSRRSEEHTSELQSRQYLVCRLLLEKKNKIHQA